MGLGGNDEPVAKPLFNIKFTDRAVEDLRVFPVSEQKWIVSALESQLASAAAEESDDRKRLRPDELAEWTIRLGDVRVFYDVDLTNQIVKIEAVGKKLFL